MVLRSAVSEECFDFGGAFLFRRSDLVSEETLCANRKLIIQKVDEQRVVVLSRRRSDLDFILN